MAYILDPLDKFSFTHDVVQRKTTIPMLSNLLCETKGNLLDITATHPEFSRNLAQEFRGGLLARAKEWGSCQYQQNQNSDEQRSLTRIPSVQ